MFLCQSITASTQGYITNVKFSLQISFRVLSLLINHIFKITSDLKYCIVRVKFCDSDKALLKLGNLDSILLSLEGSYGTTVNAVPK